jgi:hypothetical protein
MLAPVHAVDQRLQGRHQLSRRQEAAILRIGGLRQLDESLLEFLHARGKRRPLLIVGYGHTILRVSQIARDLVRGSRNAQRAEIRLIAIAALPRERRPLSSVRSVLECDVLTTACIDARCTSRACSFIE